jgi:hypothetical protein
MIDAVAQRRVRNPEFVSRTTGRIAGTADFAQPGGRREAFSSVQEGGSKISPYPVGGK